MEFRGFSRLRGLILDLYSVCIVGNGGLTAIDGTARRGKVYGYNIVALRNSVRSAALGEPARHRLGDRFPFVRLERQGITFACRFRLVYVDRDKRRHTKRKHTG